MIDTNNCSFKRKKIRNIFFDEKFSPNNCGEDVDFGLQLLNNNLKIIFKPNIEIDCKYRDNLRSFLSQQYNYGKSAYRLKMKWDRLDIDNFENFQNFFIVVGRLFFSPILNLIKFNKLDKSFLLLFLYLHRAAYSLGLLSYKISRVVNKREL